MSIGTRLKAARREKQMTLDELGVAAKSSKSYLCELEHDRSLRPSAIKLSRIAEVLGVTTDWILHGTDRNLGIAADHAFFDRYLMLSPLIRKKVRAIVDAVWSPP